jgi:lysine-N-methylase
MANNKRIVLQPTYMKEFRCIGGACEDSCCVGWRVDLDKETYLTYKKIQDEELKPIFDKMVNRKHNEKSDASYGKIKMDNKGRCPFLDENNLCKIHGKLGAEYLSDTCTYYPRIVNRVDGKLERSATMSCPEVARLALLNAEGIVFEQYEEDEGNRIKVNSIFDTEGHLYLNKPQRYFWEIRLFSLALLQNRKYTLDERLILLGIVYNNLNEIKETGKAKDIPQLLEIYNQMIENGDFKEQIEKVPTNLQIQMRIAKELIDERASLGLNNPRYVECLKETLLGLGYVNEYDINEVLNLDSASNAERH